MDPLPVPAAAPATPSLGIAFQSGAPDDEIPLGWECANPALQIDCWPVEHEGTLSRNS
jgi:hypothetical protein